MFAISFIDAHERQEFEHRIEAVDRDRNSEGSTGRVGCLVGLSGMNAPMNETVQGAKTLLGRLITSIGKFREAEPDPEAEYVTALMQAADDAASKGDYEIAAGMWRQLAEGGVARAQSSLGKCYVDGLGVEASLTTAAELFAKAAESGDPVGQRGLAALSFAGDGGVPKDEARASELFRKAAEQGDAFAQDMLSWMLLEGRGSKADPVEARSWALAAAEQQVPASMTRLGYIAQQGLGMQREPEEAARWWYEAARRGDADGQAMLGGALHAGSGVEKDDRAAMVWLLRAQVGGSALAGPLIGSARQSLSQSDIESAERAAGSPIAHPASAAEEPKADA